MFPTADTGGAELRPNRPIGIKESEGTHSEVRSSSKEATPLPLLTNNYYLLTSSY